MSKTGSLVKFTQIDPTIAVNLHILNAGDELQGMSFRSVAI